jgi:hypothetical protein
MVVTPANIDALDRIRSQQKGSRAVSCLFCFQTISPKLQQI